MDLNFRKHLFPENGFVLIDDDQRNQPGVEHFQQIFILQRFRRCLEITGGRDSLANRAFSACRLS